MHRVRRPPVPSSRDAEDPEGLVRQPAAADGQRHHELFRARRTSAGWTFEALTASSSADNLRPIVPAGSPRVLLWLRGELRSYTDYSLEVLGAPLDP